MARHPNIVNVADVKEEPGGNGEKFGYTRRMLGRMAGGEKLGCGLFRVEPGKVAFPAHLHHANEEAIYVLEGTGTLRLGDQSYPVGPGDYVAMPAGGEPHQLTAGPDATLVYLCMSTMIQPEVVEYGDSDKIGAIAGSAPGGEPARRRFFKIFRAGDEVGYYDGE